MVTFERRCKNLSSHFSSILLFKERITINNLGHILPDTDTQSGSHFILSHFNISWTPTLTPKDLP